MKYSKVTLKYRGKIEFVLKGLKWNEFQDTNSEKG